MLFSSATIRYSAERTVTPARPSNRRARGLWPAYWPRSVHGSSATYSHSRSHSARASPRGFPTVPTSLKNPHPLTCHTGNLLHARGTSLDVRHGGCVDDAIPHTPAFNCMPHRTHATRIIIAYWHAGYAYLRQTSSCVLRKPLATAATRHKTVAPPSPNKRKCVSSHTIKPSPSSAVQQVCITTQRRANLNSSNAWGAAWRPHTPRLAIGPPHASSSNPGRRQVHWHRSLLLRLPPAPLVQPLAAGGGGSC